MHTTNPMRQQVLILATSQALFQTVSVLVMTVGGLAGGAITERPELATAPIAAMFLGTAAGTFPASHLMAMAGRRTGFMLGAGLGVAGGALAALGVWLASLPLLAFGTFLAGIYQSFAQFYRFAASEAADEAFRPRAISLVFGGGIVAAFLGPFLGRIGGPLLEPAYVGSFLLLSCVSLVALAVLSRLHMPVQAANHVDTSKGRAWLKIVTQPAYLVALFGAVTGYSIMILVMTATPIAMTHHHHHDLSTTSTVIQLHVLGMFLPSFFTGSLIARFGVLKIMFTGVLVLAAEVLLSWSGTGFASFASALILLGVGWNFLYIGGTTLLTTTYTPSEKSRAQATNDMTIFAVGLASSFGAGGLLSAFGWDTLNGLMLPWLALAALVIIWLGARSRRQAAAGAVAGDAA
jgi:MFS family permease